MEISENLLCLFSADVEEQDGSYVVEIPEREVTMGAVGECETYRIAILPTKSTTESTPQRDQPQSGPPVEEGATINVEIENIGDQGDGIARVGPGYVVIVPDTEVGEGVAVEITEARKNLAFAEVVERYDR